MKAHKAEKDKAYRAEHGEGPLAATKKAEIVEEPHKDIDSNLLARVISLSFID